MGLSNSITEMLIRKAKTERRPVTVNMELLPLCNLDCRMCYIRSTPEETASLGGLKTPGEWLRLAEEMREADTLFLLLTGGEVFLYPGFRELYEGLYKMGFILTVNTNGTMIDREIVSWLRKYPPKCVSISLYGADDKTYKNLCGREGIFTRVDRAVRLLQEARIKTELKTLFTPLNAADAGRCIRYASELGIPYETAVYAFPPVRRICTSEQIRFTPEEAVLYTFACNRMQSDDRQYEGEIIKYLRKYEAGRKNPGHTNYGLSCSAANSSCWITWQGRMTPCGMMDKPGTEPFRDGFMESWEKLKEKADAIVLSEVCSHCEKRSICTVCPASAYAETGRFDKMSPYHCRMTELTLEKMYGYAETHHLKI